MAARADQESSQRSVSKLLSQRAQHHGLVTGIAGQHAAFSVAARLAVRWIAAHMMAGIHLPVEAIELMVAAAFLPSTCAVPMPGQAPFKCCLVKRIVVFKFPSIWCVMHSNWIDGPKVYMPEPTEASCHQLRLRLLLHGSVARASKLVDMGYERGVCTVLLTDFRRPLPEPTVQSFNAVD